MVQKSLKGRHYKCFLQVVRFKIILKKETLAIWIGYRSYSTTVYVQILIWIEHKVFLKCQGVQFASNVDRI